MLEAEHGMRVVWGWALHKLPGAGLMCCIGGLHGLRAPKRLTRY